jgi:TfoX/Sxy family transcriptional regulator of competence genes
VWRHLAALEDIQLSSETAVAARYDGDLWRSAAAERTCDRPTHDPGLAMTYDENLAARVRAILGESADVRERRMFGGLTFLVAGHMCCGIVDDTLMLRLNEDLANQALEKLHVRPMDFTGRPMKNIVYVDPPGCKGSRLRAWVETAAVHARSLPAKPIR